MRSGLFKTVSIDLAIVAFGMNDVLENITIYYYFESEPPLAQDGLSYDGNYWHYVDGLPLIWAYLEYN